MGKKPEGAGGYNEYDPLDNLSHRKKLYADRPLEEKKPITPEQLSQLGKEIYNFLAASPNKFFTGAQIAENLGLKVHQISKAIRSVCRVEGVARRQAADPVPTTYAFVWEEKK